MIDRKTETDIKDVKNFLEFWAKFHSIYEAIISKGTISKDDEKKFMETKDLIASKYEAFRNGLEFKYMPHSRLTDPVSDILSISGVSFMSERHLKKVNDDWRDSYIFLNSVLERFKNKKKRLEQFHPVAVFFKRIFERRQG